MQWLVGSSHGVVTPFNTSWELPSLGCFLTRSSGKFPDKDVFLQGRLGGSHEALHTYKVVWEVPSLGCFLTRLSGKFPRGKNPNTCYFTITNLSDLIRLWFRISL